MEQMQYVLTEYGTYLALAWAGIMLVFVAATLHRINKSIRMHKKNTKMLQEEIKEVRLQIELQEQHIEAARETDDRQEINEKINAQEAENWTKEQESLVNAVLGEVFS